jgi:hypothetical protein
LEDKMSRIKLTLAVALLGSTFAITACDSKKAPAPAPAAEGEDKAEDKKTDDKKVEVKADDKKVEVKADDKKAVVIADEKPAAPAANGKATKAQCETASVNIKTLTMKMMADQMPDTVPAEQKKMATDMFEKQWPQVQERFLAECVDKYNDDNLKCITDATDIMAMQKCAVAARGAEGAAVAPTAAAGDEPAVAAAGGDTATEADCEKAAEHVKSLATKMIPADLPAEAKKMAMDQFNKTWEKQKEGFMTGCKTQSKASVTCIQGAADMQAMAKCGAM